MIFLSRSKFSSFKQVLRKQLPKKRIANFEGFRFCSTSEPVKADFTAKNNLPPPISNNPEIKVSLPPPNGNISSIKILKKKIRSKIPRFMKLWYFLGIAGVVGSLMYYLNEQDRYERKIEHIIKMIESNDIEVQREGIQKLESCLFLEKKLISTVTEIPQPKTTLINSGLVEALLNSFRDGDSNLKENSGLWLARLCEEPEARRRIINSLEPILKTIDEGDYTDRLFLISGAIILNLAKYEDSASLLTNNYSIKETILKMYESKHPLGALMASQIQAVLTRETFMFSIIPPEKFDPLVSPSSTAALYSALKVVIPPEPKPFNPPNALLEGDMLFNLNALWPPIAFSILGNLWGTIRWTIAGRIGGLKQLDLKKFVSKQNKIGRTVFFLLILDPVAQLFMIFPESGIKIPYYDQLINIPQKPFGLPLTTIVPIVESTLFISAGLIGLRYQRFIFFPMFAALTFNHWNDIIENSNHYVVPIKESIEYLLDKKLN